MKTRMKFIVPISVAFACIAWAANVSTDYDHHADFGRYHTYYWIGVKAGDSLWQDRIMSAVDSQLAAKGWTKSQGSGDAGVSAFGQVNERDNLETFYDGFPGWGWRHWGGGAGMATTEVIPERVGNLTVDIFDGNTKQLVWRGQASDVLSSKPEKNDKKLDHAAADMFKKFPPPPKN
jgi:hypothetical protein